ncbi:deoxyribonuclease II family protein [Dyella sp.]|uniref:deoxyribonuclease II family protein n=1 Tax=Dyella sp. TaxID=1869338 RepID=UPI002ED6188B
MITRRMRLWALVPVWLATLAGCASPPVTQHASPPAAAAATLRSTPLKPEPVPLISSGHSVRWWFVFKFNAKAFPQCGAGPTTESCIFGGKPSTKPKGQQFVFASSSDSHLSKGNTCLGQSQEDPVGATFSQVYSGNDYYVVWNDQFYNDPKIAGCSSNCMAPWAHSKGVLAWDDNGNGFLMQVTTPSWPGGASAQHPRAAGNTLGCVSNDNNIEFSQHFFALQLNHDDLTKVLKAMANASVATDPDNPQIVRNGGPADVKALVIALGSKSASTAMTVDKLSTGVEMISKPSKLAVPPWPLVSSLLGGASLKVANWWNAPDRIPDSTASTPVDCWSAELGKPGAISSATTGQWSGVTFNLQGGASADHNHAKVAIGTDAGSDIVVFGDMNQQGSLKGHCTVAQNGRGGLFFVLHDQALNHDLAHMMSSP